MKSVRLSEYSRRLKYFLLGQYFTDGLRITFGVVIPSVVLAQYDRLETGTVLSLGALCVSLADNPGPVVHKRNGMLLCNLFIALTALITGFINHNPWLVGAEIVVLCFTFSMFNLYGARAASIGTAALLVMILGIDQHLTPIGTLKHTGYLVAGGIWYMLLSLSIYQILPYRLAQQALGDCINEVADYLRLKGRFYDIHADTDETYRELVDQQIIVHEHQDNVREILFKTRRMIKATSGPGRQLVLTFIDVVDLYEQTMATHHDYRQIREQYGKTGMLDHYHQAIQRLAEELDHIGHALNNNEKPTPRYNWEFELNRIKRHIDEVSQVYLGISTLILAKILVNLRNITNSIQHIYSIYGADADLHLPVSRRKSLTQFTSRQEFELKAFRNNLSFESATFRHALRVAFVCLIGFIAARNLPIGHHSYWILLTILVILKPGFSLTKKRNYERVIGTIIGAFAGILILVYLHDPTIKFVLLIIFMILAYSFARIRYVVSVLFMTPYILIVFSMVGDASSLQIAKERIIDTMIGSVIAGVASYLVLPNWESDHLRKFMAQMLKANGNYLRKIALRIPGHQDSFAEYRLARKEVYVSTANLASAFQRLLSEPKSRQQQAGEIQQFVVLNHMLSSYIATLSDTIHAGRSDIMDPVQLKATRRILNVLQESITLLSGPTEDWTIPEGDTPADINAKDEQMELIYKTVTDIRKTTQKLCVE